MTVALSRRPLTLAIHPSFGGFGWIVLEGPLAPHDWGLVRVRKEKNLGCLAKLDALIVKFRPQTLVLEAFEDRASLRRERVTRLCRAMVALAIDRGLDIGVCSRADIQAVFADVGARTRHEIAEAVARHIELLRPRLPKKRKAWESEQHVMALFCAAAAALAHYRYSCRSLLDDLKDEATA